MQNRTIGVWLDSSYLNGSNQSYIEQLYEDYLTDSTSVDSYWRFVFQKLPEMIENEPEHYHSKIRDELRHLARNSKFSRSSGDSQEDIKQIKVLELINAFRFYGYQNANLDPLGLWSKNTVSDLNPSFHFLTKSDFQKIFNVGSFVIGKDVMKLADIYQALKKTYCGSIGIEYMHINNKEEKCWIQNNIESIVIELLINNNEKRRFLDELTAAEGLENYLGTKFPGAKRFSLEGGDSLIVLLQEMIRHASKNETREIVLGMAHRGRLNVLVNILGKLPKDLFNEFSGQHKENVGTGDVKYHQGFSSNLEIENKLIHLTLAFNPSHLEIVNPVVIGSVRARRDRLNSMQQSKKVLPITIHGDAAITGQGVVQETLNMSQARGYEVGGTIHIIINNQIGFTTSNPKDMRSTEYCTDIYKMLSAPIFHVNSDDPEAVAFVTRVALDFRNKFKRDVIIDLVCYRRHGHNEADEPNATQPIMYQKITKHPTTRQIYADKLIKQKIINPGEDTEKTILYRDALERGDCVVKAWRPMTINSNTWSPYLRHEWDAKYKSQVDIQHLQELAKSISTIPDAIIMQPRVKKIYDDRQDMAGKNSKKNKLFDWGAAEILAYATLIDEGISIRLSGEDVSRGTFFHRHAVIHNQEDGSVYIPLCNIKNTKKPAGKFQVWDSVLSEEAVLAFEYGYASTEPRTLTIWEAQFGDFANGAQVVIDQFISSGEQKWGRMCGLVMLLPHGYEGQGPEHSSARLERYLQLCAEQNIQVCVPSTPAQVYHMLRRQVLRGMRRPLIVISPKSLLRHPLATSPLDELANGTFQPAITEIDLLNVKKIDRVLICSGKIYYDLLKQRRENQQTNVAIIRIEQIYPFPNVVIKNILKDYEHVRDFVWCQEEPINQGAWYFIKNNFYIVLPQRASLRYVGRPSAASPAVGYMSIHQKQQRDLVNEALKV